MENSYEYIIKQKNEGKVLLKRLLLAFGYFVFAALLVILTIGFMPVELYPPVLIAVLALVAFVIFVSWRFVCIEYEVIISGGDITITTIYGKGFGKKLLNRPINSFTEIGEYDDKAFEEISKLSLQKNYICLSSLSAPDIYYALFEEEKCQCILYFDAPSRAVEILKKSNSAAFRASDKRFGRK